MNRCGSHLQPYWYPIQDRCLLLKIILDLLASSSCPFCSPQEARPLCAVLLMRALALGVDVLLPCTGCWESNRRSRVCRQGCLLSTSSPEIPQRLSQSFQRHHMLLPRRTCRLSFQIAQSSRPTELHIPLFSKAGVCMRTSLADLSLAPPIDMVIHGDREPHQGRHEQERELDRWSS